MGWGTLKLQKARNTRLPVEMIESLAEENLWNFGQLLPVFLLLGPLFFLVSLLVRELRGPSTPAIDSTRGVDTVTSRTTPQVVQDDSHNDGGDRNDGAVTQLPTLEREYYLTAAWTLPCVVLLCLNALGLAGLFFFFAATVFEETILDFWAGSYGISLNFFFPTFCGSVIAILVGLAMDEKVDKGLSRTVKTITLIVLSLILHSGYWVYFTVYIRLTVVRVIRFEEILGLAIAFWGCTYGLYVVVCIWYRLLRLF